MCIICIDSMTSISLFSSDFASHCCRAVLRSLYRWCPDSVRLYSFTLTTVTVIGPHHLHAVHRCRQLLAMLHTGKMCKNRWINQGAISGDSCMPKEPRINDGPDLHGNGHFEDSCRVLPSDCLHSSAARWLPFQHTQLTSAFALTNGDDIIGNTDFCQITFVTCYYCYRCNLCVHMVYMKLLVAY